MRSGSLWYINQDDPKLIKLLGLDQKLSENGGIKSLFLIGNRTFVYVAYKDGNCASARIVDISSMEVAFQFPCLPNLKNVDLNGVGGAWLSISDSEGLLSTGTPTMVNVRDSINKNAQLDESLWGKLLKLRLVNEKLEVTIFTKGHRNPQGLAKIDGVIFGVEHGPMGGDEINIIKEGRNYGWPIQSLGSEYDRGLINKSFSQPIATEMPMFSFVPSVGISYINKCPQSYSDYYSPNNCIAVSSMRGQAIDFVIHKDGRVLFSEKMQFKSRIRKFFVQENSIVAVTDYQGIIVGRLKKVD